jgi:hypothetical protein
VVKEDFGAVGALDILNYPNDNVYYSSGFTTADFGCNLLVLSTSVFEVLRHFSEECHRTQAVLIILK